MGKNIVLGISGWKRSGKDTAGDIIRNEIFKISKDWNVHLLSFSSFFKQAISIMFDYDDFLLECNDIQKEDILPDSVDIFGQPKSYRDLLIDVGEGLKEIFTQDLWANTMRAKIYRYSLYSQMNEESRKKYQALHPVDTHIWPATNNIFIITDVRFHKEFEMMERLASEGYDTRKLWIFNSRTTPEFANAMFDKFIQSEISSVENTTRIIKEKYPDAHRSEYEWLFHMQDSVTISNNGTLDVFESSVREYAATLIGE